MSSYSWEHPVCCTGTQIIHGIVDAEVFVFPTQSALPSVLMVSNMFSAVVVLALTTVVPVSTVVSAVGAVAVVVTVSVSIVW